MQKVNSGWLIYRPENKKLIPHVKDCAEHLEANLEPVEFSYFLENIQHLITENSHLVALLEHPDLGAFFQAAQNHPCRIGILPVHRKSKVCQLYNIPARMEDAMPLALASDRGIKLDLLSCNDEIVTWMISIGDAPFIHLKKIADQEGLWWQRLKSIPSGIPSLFRLQPKMVTVTTAQNIQYKTVIIGAFVIENDIEGLVPHYASTSVSPLDGKLSAVLLAPSSVMDYVSFLIASVSFKPKKTKAISYFKTGRLIIESSNVLNYHLDGVSRSSNKIIFDVIPKAVSVNVGHQFILENPASESDKDTVKIKTLPQDEDRLTRIKQHLPLFSIAKVDEFKELFLLLTNYAHPSFNFLMMMVLSAMLATLGLFLNSAPVVIGAMLVAPLMGPLVSLAMGLLRNNTKLMKDAFQVFWIGTGIALLVAIFTTLFMPYEQATDEIRSRLQPNLLDLAVAIVSGIIAAYVHSKENLQKSLAGVAVAVALVPPVCVIGIGIGWLNWSVISGASLLFITNFIGIVLASMLTFLTLGFAPVITVTRSLGFSLLLAVLVTVPLFNAFKNTVLYHRTEKNISTQVYEVNNKKITLSDVSVISGEEKMKIVAQLHSSESIETSDIALLRDVISNNLDQPITLDVTIHVIQ